MNLATSQLLPTMCGRVIQSSGPLRLAIVEGLNVSDSRMGNVPARYNAAPSLDASSFSGLFTRLEIGHIVSA
jgi:hypothetical protein